MFAWMKHKHEKNNDYVLFFIKHTLLIVFVSEQLKWKLWEIAEFFKIV